MISPSLKEHARLTTPAGQPRLQHRLMTGKQILVDQEEPSEPNSERNKYEQIGGYKYNVEHEQDQARRDTTNGRPTVPQDQQESSPDFDI